MIAELTDKEILEFLMTSDFNENLSPDETRFLLLKFRNFYRVTSSRNDLLSSDLETARKNLTELSNLRQTVQQLLEQNKNLSEKLDTIMNKKLSIKERFFGKIIEIKNELI